MQVVEQPTIKEGDIFHWRYRDEKRHSDYLSYWAKSRIAVATLMYLNDTFSDYSNPDWTHSEAREKLILARIGNFAVLERQPEYMADYYDDRDIVNINHSNSSRGNFYIRKGAKRSPDKMIETLDYKITRAESEIVCAQRLIERLRDTKQKIMFGETLDKLYVD